MTKPTSSTARIPFRYYLLIFMTAFFVGVAVFLATEDFVRPHELCANSQTCKEPLVEQVDNEAMGTFQGRVYDPPDIDLSSEPDEPAVLGIDSAPGEKHIYVDLETQTLYAMQGETEYMQTYIASGKWGRTPVGNFNIWTKLRSTRMPGGSGDDYYNLPNVPHTMYFYRDFGLHGAYWHNNFGHAMSHGCVNLRLVDAEKLFEWADGPSGSEKGTPVSVCNQFTAPNTCVQINPVN